MSRMFDSKIAEQAVSWHLRLQDADELVWASFADWLEADPRHNEAYEAVADGDERLAQSLRAARFPVAPRTLDDAFATVEYAETLNTAAEPDRVRRMAWRWGALAASIAVVGALAFQQIAPDRGSYAIETAPGEMRTIALADGSEIMLNGHSRIVLDRNDPRTAELASGEARFKIEHDENDPFTVIAEDSRLVDIGTVFNVVHSGGQLQVGVAEGAVRFEGYSKSIELRTGDLLSARSGEEPRISRKPVAAIGSWAQGALVYDNAPLGIVSEDLSRSLGVTFILSPAMRSRPFSGVIQIEGGKEATRMRLEEILGVSIAAKGTSWTVKQ